jgi:hypothetical protein
MLNNEIKKGNNKEEASKDKNSMPSVPAISLPKGGGAIRGMGEKFSAGSRILSQRHGMANLIPHSVIVPE